jgi:DNA-directed RNA polymerase specialized sigma24 family protein
MEHVGRHSPPASSVIGLPVQQPDLRPALLLIGESERIRASWDAVVADCAPSLWAQARGKTRSLREAVEVTQLVWLRFETATRSGDLPRDPASWLLREVEQECVHQGG